MMNGHINTDSSAKTENLKLVNKELKEKIINQESQIAEYEDKLSKNMEDLLSTKLCMDSLKNSCEALEKENLTLKEELIHFKARIHQIEELKLKRTEDENAIINLQKDLSTKDKVQRKLKSELETTTQKLSDMNSNLKKVKSTNKRLWTLISEFGKALSKDGLLTEKQKKILLKEHPEDISGSDIDSKDDSNEDGKSFLGEIATSSDSGIKTISDSACVHSTVSPPLSTQNFSQDNSNKSNPLKIIPSETNQSEVAQITNSNKLEFISKHDNLSKQSKTHSMSSIIFSAKGKSCGSNYFLKSCKEVLDDPQMMDCEVTFKELQDLRQQLPVCNEHFAPISPIPRTPSPKNLKSKLTSNSKTHLLRPPGKRLNFCHQQSESFDVPEMPPSAVTDCLIQNHADNASKLSSPESDPGKYTLSTKRDHDGSLKFFFSANVNSQLCLDMNTLQVSCVVMPQSTSQDNFHDTGKFCTLTPIDHLTDVQHTTRIVHSKPQSIKSVNTVSVSKNKKQHTDASNFSNEHQNEISTFELENSTLNDIENDRISKKIRLENDGLCEKNFLINQKSNGLLTSFKKNTPKKNCKQMQDLQVKCVNSKESGSSDDILNGKDNLDNLQSAFTLHLKSPEPHNIVSDSCTPEKLLNYSYNLEEKKIKCCKSIGKINKKNNILTNQNDFFKVPLTTESQNMPSKLHKENTHSTTPEKKSKKIQEQKSDELEILANGVNMEYISDGKKSKEDQFLCDSEDVRQECELIKGYTDNSSSAIWRNEKSVKSSSSENLLSKNNKLHSESNSVLSSSHNLLNFNNCMELQNESPNSVLSKEVLLPDVKICSDTSLPSSLIKENFEMLPQFSPNKNTDLKSNADSFKPYLGQHDLESEPEKLLIDENFQSSNKENCTVLSVIPCNKGMFTPKGLFSNPVISDNLPVITNENTSNLDENALNTSKSYPISGSVVPCSSFSESSRDFNEYLSSHNSFLLNDSSHVEAIVHSSINSETTENILGAHALSMDVTIVEGKSSHSDSDELHGDHTLMIVENVDVLNSNNVESDDNIKSYPKLNVRERNAKKKKSLKKRKKSVNANLKQSRKILKPNNPLQFSIASAFDSLDQMKFTDMHFKLTQHSLVTALINPINASSTKDVVYHVLKYLSASKSNPFLSYYMGCDAASLFPLTEKCIVSVLATIGKKKKQHLQGILHSAIDNIYQVVLTKDRFSIYGLSSLCRVMTELCKCESCKRTPLMLCADLLKSQHKYTPYLIASIASVWKELFDVHSALVQERIFHSSVAYGVQKKPKTLTDQQWIHCSKILSTHLSAKPFTEIEETIKSLMEIINIVLKDGQLEAEYAYTTPIVTVATVEGWEWAKENIIDKYIIPLMVKYSKQECNVQAFKFFCNLYVDICNFCPDLEQPNEVLSNFFEIENEGKDSIRNAVAMAQMKLILLKKFQLLPLHLTEWVDKNQIHDEIADFMHKLFRKRLMMDESDLLESEIL